MSDPSELFPLPLPSSLFIYYCFCFCTSFATEVGLVALILQAAKFVTFRAQQRRGGGVVVPFERKTKKKK